MANLYRFRKCRQSSINNLLSLRIEGSKYSEMTDDKEVSLTIDIERIKDYTKLSQDVIAKTHEIIRKHIINSYYIACFSKTDQLDDIDMWKEYAGSNGFCLVYNDVFIRNAINIAMRRNRGKFLIFRDVDYGNDPTDITDFVIDYLSLVGDDIENEEAHKYASKHAGDKLSIEQRRKITNSMFHKIGQFPEKDEKRIVLLGKEEGNPFCNDMISIVVKPSKIYCSSLMDCDVKKELERFAKKNNIDFEIKLIKK